MHAPHTPSRKVRRGTDNKIRLANRAIARIEREDAQRAVESD